jgi:hypothetical protein
MKGLLRELKRRKVVRVTLAYAAGAFVAVQAAQLYFPALGLPDWAFRAVAVLSLLGLPVAIVLAWVFDITPDGVRRTSAEPTSHDAELADATPLVRRSVFAAVIVVLVIGGIAGVTLRSSGAVLDRERVLVMTFENLAGNATLDPVGRMAAEWLTQGLAGTGIVEVVPAITVLTVMRAIEGSADLAGARTVARELGAGTVVWGAYYSSAGRLSFSTHITDVASGRLLGSLDPVSAPMDDPAAGLLELRDRVMSGLGAVLNPRLAGWPGAMTQPWSWAAYQEYADGMERYVASDYLAAAAHFGRAFEMDTALLIAAVWQAHSNANAVDLDAALATAEWLEARRQRLSPYDRAFFDRLRARLRGDVAAAYAAALRMVEIAPSSDDAQREAALDALRLNRAGEALERLLALNTDRGWARGWREYWFFVATAYHQLGRHGDELRAAREGRRRDPDRSFIWDNLEATALAALGRPDEVAPLIDRAIEQHRHRVPPAALLANAAAALRAHGHEEHAMRLFARAAAEPVSDHAAPAGEPTVRARGIQLGSAMLRADALLAVGELAAAAEAYTAIVAATDTSGLSLESRVRLGALALLAVTAARAGDVDTADRFIAEVAATQLVNERWRVAYARAGVAAARGDTDDGVRLLREAFAHGLQHVTNPMEYQVRDHAPVLHPLRAHAGYRELMRPVRTERRR